MHSEYAISARMWTIQGKEDVIELHYTHLNKKLCSCTAESIAEGKGS